MNTSRPMDAVDLGESLTTTWIGKGFSSTVEKFFQRNLATALSFVPPMEHVTSSPPNGFRNLTVLVWIVNDLDSATDPVDVLGPGPFMENAMEVEVSIKDINGTNQGNKSSSKQGSSTSVFTDTVVSGVPDHSPALLFHSSVPRRRHTQQIETYDGECTRPSV